jgi:hypothetical protein
MLRTSVSDDAGVELDFCTMSQKSSVPQAVSFVSQVLKRDTLRGTIGDRDRVNPLLPPPTSKKRPVKSGIFTVLPPQVLLRSARTVPLYRAVAWRRDAAERNFEAHIAVAAAKNFWRH